MPVPRFDHLRERWLPMLGAATSYAPPTAGDAAAMDALRRDLAWLRERRPKMFRACFLEGRPQRAGRREEVRFQRLAEHGLVVYRGPTIYDPCVRLFPLEGRLVATDLLSHHAPDQVFSLTFEQAYFVRHMGIGSREDVLELCVGSGALSLAAADRARSVTAVDLSPRALAFARFNEALGPGAVPVALHEGSLFEPLDEGRRFDHILVNPPFEPVPPDTTYFQHSAGGADGLALIRDILDGVADRLTPTGRLTMVTWSPGTTTGPIVAGLWRLALPGHRLSVHVLDEGPIGPALERFSDAPTYDAWCKHLKERGLTHLYFVFLTSAPAETPGLEFPDPDPGIDLAREISNAWR